jgi:hypothetical protein
MKENETVSHPLATFVALVGVPIIVAAMSYSYLYRLGEGEPSLSASLLIYGLGIIPGMVICFYFVTKRLTLTFGYAFLSFLVITSVSYVIGCHETGVCL